MTKMPTKETQETPESLLSFGFGETPVEVIRAAIATEVKTHVDALRLMGDTLSSATGFVNAMTDPDELLTVLDALRLTPLSAHPDNAQRRLRIDILATLGITEG